MRLKGEQCVQVAEEPSGESAVREIGTGGGLAEEIDVCFAAVLQRASGRGCADGGITGSGGGGVHPYHRTSVCTL